MEIKNCKKLFDILFCSSLFRCKILKVSPLLLLNSAIHLCLATWLTGGKSLVPTPRDAAVNPLVPRKRMSVDLQEDPKAHKPTGPPVQVCGDTATSCVILTNIGSNIGTGGSTTLLFFFVFEFFRALKLTFSS